MTIKIEDKLISKKAPCFIIAEAGVNHNGDIKLAKELVDKAKEAKVDAIKFQTFKAENLVTKKAKKEKYQKTDSEEFQYSMLKRLELSESEQKKLVSYCKKKKIIFLSTPYDEESADLLEKLGVPAFKVGSGELTHLPLLKHIAKKKLPMIVSTGASYPREIEKAVKTIRKEGNNKIILLHCTSVYPTLVEEVSLKALQTIKKTFGLPVGYSDHTLGITIPIMAVTLGAAVLEKHFTLDKNLPGPDHKASLEPQELKEMVKAVREVEKALGSSIKKPAKSEREERKLGRRSITAKIDIPKGVKITKDMLIIKRPGTGIKPKYFDVVIGKIAQKKIKKDSLIAFKDLR